MTSTVHAQAPSTRGWKINKRDGRVEAFDPEKIVVAVRKCFINGLKADEATATERGQEIRDRVVNSLKGSKPETLSVEDTQRLVIQQLWAAGYFEAAEHYTLYRENRRKQRRQRPAAPEEVEAIAGDVAIFGNDLRYYQFLSKYARWRDDKGRRETWRECVDRVLGFFRSRPKLSVIPDYIWAELDAGLYNHRAACASRILQMAGPALERCNVGAYNCAFQDMDCLEAFAELLYVLMQGTGEGFSVEAMCVDQLPRIRKQRRPAVVHKFVIPDSTEGWCDALLFGLRAWYAGEDVEFDYSQIRPAGARLKTKGGRASGPEPLKRLLVFTREKVLASQGGRLSDVNAHDIGCMIGKIVQVGGVRRAAEISISDLDSEGMRFAKHGDWWNKAPMRDMANNSAAYDEKPDAITFMKEWLSLAESGSGERGIFNRYAINRSIPKRRKRVRFGINPCGEIILRSCQFCNLSIVIARHDDTEETLREKVRLAAIWGTLQSTLTDFKYIRDVWRQNCEEERLLGVDITGQMDCPLLRPSNPDRGRLLRDLYQVVDETNVEVSRWLGINRSAGLTCVKPSGNSGEFYGCSSGVGTRYSKHKIRRFRAGRPEGDPLSKFLIDQGVPWNPDPMNESLIVFDFIPDPAPEGAPCRNDMTALQQLDNWLEVKTNWADHSVSCTIFVEPHEWLEVGFWVYNHFEFATSLAFLPKDGGNYRLMPNEEITAEEHARLTKQFPRIDWSKLPSYEQDDYTTGAQEYACVGGTCAL